MNTVGKILVILNFLFAVIVGLLLVFDIALRNKWKEAHESVVREAKVLKESLDTNERVTRKVVQDYVAAQAEVEKQLQKLNDANFTRTEKENEYKAQVADLQTMLKIKDQTVFEAQKGNQRLVDEVALQTATLKEREASINRLEASIKELRTSAVQYESLARTAQIRSENLLEQVRELTLALTREKSGVVSADVMVVRNPNEPNPPSGLVNGKIERVDNDLIQISLGTDHGVAKNHTLDVYRLQPTPKYLGMVRIVDANHHQSVARLVGSGNVAFRTPLLVGDLVTSKLTK